MKYRYFISFNANWVGASGFGNREVRRTRPITGISDIEEIGDALERELNLPKGSVVVLYYRLFDDEV